MKDQFEDHNPGPTNVEMDDDTDIYMDQKLEEYKEMLNILNEEVPDDEYHFLVDFYDDHQHPLTSA